ncbi:MAG TPA: phosphatidylinositol-specific phospholipase C1-like protein [Phenylobacterium sp.]|nr:phosphatidylinositol-specific phospholipase C1-like protein [Phenylobacterium sp.]
MISAIFAAALAVAANCDLEHPSGRPGCTRAAVDALPMNAIQVIGTHNSYKKAIAPAEFALIKAVQPKLAATLDYSKPPLAAQLDAGARQLELDFVYDPAGGRFASPLALKMANDAAAAPYDPEPMKRPGMKVMHVPDFDYRSVCPTFVACISEIRAWSKAHPDHLPILVIFNLKDDKLEGVPGAAEVLPFDAHAMDVLDAEIRSVFPAGALITPDRVQGKRATLREAVAAGGWPRLKTARGKVMFAMDEGKTKTSLYRGDRKVLEGRAAFINTDEDSPAAAYITLNEPFELAGRIEKALKAGLIVRTRADADTVEARANDRARQDAAFATGAQYVSTDYLAPDTRFGPYETHLPGGGVGRLNPITAR